MPQAGRGQNLSRIAQALGKCLVCGRMRRGCGRRRRPCPGRARRGRFPLPGGGRRAGAGPLPGLDSRATFRGEPVMEKSSGDGSGGVCRGPRLRGNPGPGICPGAAAPRDHPDRLPGGRRRDARRVEERRSGLVGFSHGLGRFSRRGIAWRAGFPAPRAPGSGAIPPAPSRPSRGKAFRFQGRPGKRLFPGPARFGKRDPRHLLGDRIDGERVQLGPVVGRIAKRHPFAGLVDLKRRIARLVAHLA